jgi:hypothetical protein
MPDITVSVVTTRTTTNEGGHQFHTVTGRGRTPEDALADLAVVAHGAAAKIASGFWLGIEKRPDAYWRAYYHDDAGRPTWPFEVVDVKMAAGPLDSGESGWLAFGTLWSQAESKPDLGWWDPKPPPTMFERASKAFRR